MTRPELVITVGIPHSPRSVLGGDPVLRRAYHCLSHKSLIEVFDQDGRIFRMIDRPYECPPFTDADKTEFLTTTGGSQRVTEVSKDVPWPKLKTVTDRMLCDDRGFLWLATSETKTEARRKRTAYDIFDIEGRYDARIWLDFNPVSFAAGKMYRWKENPESGVRILTRYRVVWE